MNSRRLTAFCTPFGQYEFTKLPMGISIGYQLLCRVVDSLFGDVKFTMSLILWTIWWYTQNLSRNTYYTYEIFERLESAGFTLNREKVHLAKNEITFLGHSLSAEKVKVLAVRVVAIREFPPPKNLKAVRRFLEMQDSMPVLSRTFRSLLSRCMP
jgi:hypothetical protein